MLSELAVFKDLIPSYRIRLPTAKERVATVTKEVKKVREYEHSLLTAYQAYLKHLEACVKTGAAKWAKEHERSQAVHGTEHGAQRRRSRGAVHAPAAASTSERQPLGARWPA